MLYFEDFAVGQQIAHGSYTVGKDEAIAFATMYDPQYFHIDEEAAKHSMFGKLALSGWHTAGISMRLKVQSPMGQIAGGMIGMGLESVKWPQPVYPGDTLRIVVTLTGCRPSGSKPSHGILSYRIETYNQRDELVMTAVTSAMVARKPS